MKDIYLLDEKLKRQQIIDKYSSLIWNPKYNEIGNCEVCVSVSSENIKKISECRYIMREDDEMVCEIVGIDLKTDEENGDSLIVTGEDVKRILHSRIVAKQTNFNGLVEDYIRTLINDSIINPTNSDRKISNFILGDKYGFNEEISQQVTYDNVGEKIEELCQQYGWGYKVTVENEKFVFYLYEGEDLSDSVFFSPYYDNISTTDYSEDKSNLKNVALVAGEGEGVDRTTVEIGEGTGIDRYELYVDARDVSSAIDYDELIENYPNGAVKNSNGTTYYQVDGSNIAIITYDDDNEIDECTLCEDVYLDNLKSTGYDKMTDYQEVTSFSGEVITGRSYTYKEDYSLGDIVTINNEYGIEMQARITEILESKDKDGYVLEPSFENI